MAFCKKCGSELGEGSAFCPHCGASMGAGERLQAPGAPPPPPPPPEAAPPAAEAVAPPAHQPPPAVPVPGYVQPSGVKKGGGGKVLLFSILGLTCIGVVVLLLLGFAVGPKWFTGGGTGSPEEVVGKFFEALENKDSKLMRSTIAPSALDEMESMGFEDMFEEYFFSTYESMEFSGLKYETTMHGNDKATVKVVAGKATVVDEYGEETTSDVEDAETPAEFKMVKEGGKWYIDFMGM